MTPNRTPHRLANLPRHYVRSYDADELARILDGADHVEPEVVARQRAFNDNTGKSGRIVGKLCIAIAVFAVLVFGAQMLRGVL